MKNAVRTNSYGEFNDLSVFDKFGVYLSKVKLRKTIKGKGKIIDLGCGYNATILSELLKKNSELEGFAVDINLNSNLEQRNIRIFEKTIEDAITEFPSDSFDYVMLISVLEHLENPEAVLKQINRILNGNGKLIINVPTWTGKFFLELIAFKLKVNDTAYIEMNDHKRYYDKKELWKVLVEAGFLPSNIKMKHHKFFLNLFAIVSKG